MEIKTLQQGLGFIKRSFNSIELAQAASTGANGKGKVVFDTTHKIICVDGVAFGGNITDATFNESILTITKATGDPVVINFSDIASASRMMEVFQDFADLMGLDSHNGIDYSDTNYLSELGQQGKPAKNLVNADKALDAKIKKVNDAIAGMDGTAGIASESNGVVTIKSGVTQSDGKISNDSGSDITLAKVATTGDAVDVDFDNSELDPASGINATNVQNAIKQVVDEIIKNEQTTEAAVEAIKNAAGLTDNLEYQPGQNTQYIDKAKDISDALNKLDAAIGGIVSGVSDVQIGGTSVVGTGGVANIATNGTYNASTNKIATEKTVSGAIENLDVNGYAQAEIDTTTTQGQTTLKIKGIKEVDGKISEGSSNGVDIAIDGTYNASTNKIATKSTVTTAIEALDGSAVIASQTGNVVTIKTGVTEVDGVISNDTGTDIVLKEVAVTGAAADVSVADAYDHFTSTDVEGALAELASAVEALQGAFDVVVSKDAATTPYGVTWIDNTDPQNPQQITGTLVASADTFHKVYLVPAGGSAPNTYSEYITTRTNTGTEQSPVYVYGWEKLGDIAVDLTGYVKTVTVNDKVYAVDSNSTNISLGNVITAVTGETAITGGNSNFVAVTATPTTDATTGENSIALTSTVKTHTVEDATSGSDDGLATAKNVKDYVDGKSAVVNSNPTIIANDTTAAQIGTVGGTALTAKVALYWDEWESGSGNGH